MLIALTGTPGMGKTSISKILRSKGYKTVGLNSIAESKKFFIGYDNLRESKILDIDSLNTYLKEKYLKAAHLAKNAGFDGIDIKSCHGYLLIELLGAFTRKNSRYGESFENRTRFLLEVVKMIKSEIPELIVTTRLNVFDAYSYPYAFGVGKNDFLKPDLF